MASQDAMYYNQFPTDFEEDDESLPVDHEEEDYADSDAYPFGNMLFHFVREDLIDLVRQLLFTPSRKMLKSAYWKNPDADLVSFSPSSAKGTVCLMLLVVCLDLEHAYHDDVR